MWSFMRGLCYVKYFGYGTAFKEVINENRRCASSKYMIFQIVFDEYK